LSITKSLLNAQADVEEAGERQPKFQGSSTMECGASHWRRTQSWPALRGQTSNLLDEPQETTRVRGRSGHWRFEACL
jgi:hypothetical protein